MSYETQSASALFLVPIEIRRAIYASLVDPFGIHITLSPDGRVRLTRCLSPDLGAQHVGFERRPATDEEDPDRQIWCRRLGSGWGPHWECEEMALAKGTEESDGSRAATGGSFLTTCKRLHFEAMNWVREQVYFHLTDFATISAMLDISPSSSVSPPTPSATRFSHLLLASITRLCITMSLPLSFFECFDDRPSPSGEEVPPLDRMQAHIWRALPLELGVHLTSLRRLRIWLDHCNVPIWSVVNERAVLGHFEPLARTPHVDVSLDLPKLHPRAEDPLRHLLEDEGAAGCRLGPSSPRLRVRRRLRQRYHIYKDPQGRYVGPAYASDFPVSLGTHLFQALSLEEREKLERTMETHGQSVRDVLMRTQPAWPHMGGNRRGHALR